MRLMDSVNHFSSAHVIQNSRLVTLQQLCHPRRRLPYQAQYVHANDPFVIRIVPQTPHTRVKCRLSAAQALLASNWKSRVAQILPTSFYADFTVQNWYNSSYGLHTHFVGLAIKITTTYIYHLLESIGKHKGNLNENYKCISTGYDSAVWHSPFKIPRTQISRKKHVFPDLRSLCAVLRFFGDVTVCGGSTSTQIDWMSATKIFL